MSHNLEDGGVLPASKGPMKDLGPASGTSMSEMRAAQRANEEYNLPLSAQRYMVEPINANKYALGMQYYLVRLLDGTLSLSRKWDNTTLERAPLMGTIKSY